MNTEEKILEELSCLVGEDPAKQAVVTECLATLNQEQLSLVRLVRCSDGKNGLRFGKVAKRVGRCRKVGNARKENGNLYQIWLDWSGSY